MNSPTVSTTTQTPKYSVKWITSFRYQAKSGKSPIYRVLRPQTQREYPWYLAWTFHNSFENVENKRFCAIVAKRCIFVKKIDFNCRYSEQWEKVPFHKNMYKLFIHNVSLICEKFPLRHSGSGTHACLYRTGWIAGKLEVVNLIWLYYTSFSVSERRLISIRLRLLNPAE